MADIHEHIGSISVRWDEDCTPALNETMGGFDEVTECYFTVKCIADGAAGVYRRVGRCTEFVDGLGYEASVVSFPGRPGSILVREHHWRSWGLETVGDQLWFNGDGYSAACDWACRLLFKHMGVEHDWAC